ncbi:branched-chain amino acid transporter [Hafnia paralvei ATCC 29927]|jgi:hypothetical protein|uniref:L-valine transporter subunit YgaH n=2 Tax=Hafniaceae TaxID=1903412 RepID=A0A2A2MG35_9GAMM|nr:L-valine transporter subunit YgaH [Hafnia paralvei]EFV41770.1 hypothetical protein HMPREF0864_00099 [Enterobacteriaceae bacterium 9_2_54FAA]OAT39546.1 branched-chain amino acid transporter [Hafnia paralvei ATCC 29927]KHS46431.1 L-valine exporter [Hafnia paralvei]NIH30024.1 L-valine transporter subunit YgaH [Hafnia paralvei]
MINNFTFSSLAMDSTVVTISLIVGGANFLFRYLPLRLGRARKSDTAKQGIVSLLLDNIGIASICALLVVSSTPEILSHHERFIPTLCGFLALSLCFYRTQSIIMSTISGAVTFGLVFKMMMMFT